MYRADFAVDSLAGLGAKDRSMWLRIKVSSKELTDVKGMAKCYSGRMGEQIGGGRVKQENMAALLEEMFQNVKTRIIGGD